jgi:integrase/recombinase XerD
MKRRKKPRASGATRERDAAEASGIYPYLLRFLEWFASRGYAEHTTALRNDAIRRFIRWCGERSIDRPQDVTRPILERYRRHLYHYRKENGEPLSFATQQQRLLPLRAFFKWLAKENYILSNPASELELPRVHRRLPAHVLNRDEVEQVMRLAIVHGGDKAIRDRAILETLYTSGIRRGELVNLKLYDVDLKNGSLFVREGKGKKDRYVPLGSRASHWIRRYVEELRPELVIEPDEGFLFLHEFGERFEKNRLSDLVKKYLRAAGIEAGSCHLFRHAMATQMLENGADIRFIQAILGHAQLTTTEIYTHVTIAKLKEVHALTHPAEQRRQPGIVNREESDALLAALAADEDDGTQSASGKLTF